MSVPADYDRQIEELRKYAEKNGIPWEQVKPKPLGDRMQEQHEAWMEKLKEERKSNPAKSFGDFTSGSTGYPLNEKQPMKEEMIEIFGITEEEYDMIFGKEVH